MSTRTSVLIVVILMLVIAATGTTVLTMRHKVEEMHIEYVSPKHAILVSRCKDGSVRHMHMEVHGKKDFKFRNERIK